MMPSTYPIRHRIRDSEKESFAVEAKKSLALPAFAWYFYNYELHGECFRVASFGNRRVLLG
jgi:hypothetical protein